MRTVLCAEGLYEPTAGLLEYLDRWPATPDDPVRVLFGTRRTPPPSGLGPSVHLAGLMPGRGLRGHEVGVLAGGYSDVCRWIRSGALRIDAVVAVADRASGGGYTLGVVDGYLQLALDRARTIVIELFRGLPRVRGAAVAPRADALVAAPPTPGFVPLAAGADDLSRRMAAHVVPLLTGARTLSLGVGRVAGALADLAPPTLSMRITTGVLDEAVLTLVRRGVVAPDQPIRAMAVLGTDDLTSWAASDERVELCSSEQVHEPRWLARQRGFTVVLSALEVDRHGNLNGERLHDRWVSGRGGARDLAQGAHLSPGGRCVVCLPSCGPDGSSNLVDEVAATTVPAALVDAVVTEKGAAVRTGPAGSTTSRLRWQRDLAAIF